ncbi:MAG: hypothetical protein QXI93_00340 [Candidatus Methanomethylicia archaeon]
MNNFGISKITELLLAMVIISSTSTLLTSFSYNMVGGEDLYSITFRLFSTLESHGYLTILVFSNNWDDLVNYIKPLLPSNIYFKISVYDEDLNEIFSYGVTPYNFTQVVSVPFLLSYRGVTRIIVLQIWR